MRGGTEHINMEVLKDEGLSPLARGNQLGVFGGFFLQGPIPACAGEPPHRYWAALPPRAYPRLRGGTVKAYSSLFVPQGLSPLARGNRAASTTYPCSGGPIPACAGEPCGCCCRHTLARAYPRLRGGTGLTSNASGRYQGLSPLARGNLEADLHRCGRYGPIPACAGEPTG